ncbi:Lrp/AsnC family transcriptional regulator, partial [Pantoea agglomerans]
MAQAELDAIDRRILAILQENGRLSNQEIAERVNLSPSPCLRRIRRLEEIGVITGYVALLNPQKLGLDLLAYVSVRLEKRGGLAPVRVDET